MRSLPNISNWLYYCYSLEIFIHFSRQVSVCRSGGSSSMRWLPIGLHSKPSGSLMSSPYRNHTPRRTRAGSRRRRRLGNGSWKTGSLGATWMPQLTGTPTISFPSGTSTLKCRYIRVCVCVWSREFYEVVHFSVNFLIILQFLIPSSWYWLLNCFTCFFHSFFFLHACSIKWLQPTVPWATTPLQLPRLIGRWWGSPFLIGLTRTAMPRSISLVTRCCGGSVRQLWWRLRRWSPSTWWGEEDRYMTWAMVSPPSLSPSLPSST